MDRCINALGGDVPGAGTRAVEVARALYEALPMTLRYQQCPRFADVLPYLRDELVAKAERILTVVDTVDAQLADAEDGTGRTSMNVVQAAVDLLAEHHEVARYRGSGVRCACGALIRQIRPEQPTWQEHYVQVLADAGLLTPGEGPQTAEWQQRAANATEAAKHALGGIAKRESGHP